MSETSAAGPVDPQKEAQETRRKNREEVQKWIAVALPTITVLTTVLGFSPLAKIWSALFLIIGFGLATYLIVWHHRGGDVAIPTGFLNRPDKALPSGRARFLNSAMIVALIFGAGAWVGSSARDAITLLMYGSLGDLATGSALHTTDPATIQLRENGGYVCYYTKVTFNIRNATATDLLVGILSETIAMSDDTNSPIFSTRYPQDITQTGAGVSAIALVTGKTSALEDNINQIKSSLTTLRRGTSTDVTVFQNQDGTNTCLPDPNRTLFKSYNGKTARASGEVLMVFPDGTFRRQGVSSGDLTTLVSKEMIQ